MLKPEENDRLVRVGRGKPAGELFRRYWQPALLSSELPEREGPPLRVRLLGEDLIAFRDTEGRVGLMDAFCPHRRAPMFYARNEECGLRCIYHGWKFDVTGACVDMPSEPKGMRMMANVRISAYPTVERGGIVWAFLGPKPDMPDPPDYEWLRAPPTHRFVSKTFENCNYLQALEGGLDTAHSSFLHNNNIRNAKLLRTRDQAPQIDVKPTDYGYYYVSTRAAGEGHKYVRVYQYVMPFQQMRANYTAREGQGREQIPKLDGHLWVPIDDEHTFVFNWTCSYDDSAPLTEQFVQEWESTYGRGTDDLIPGTFKLKLGQHNDYLIDREVQRTQTFSGIRGINTQDMALQEGMGPIVDRSKEILGTSDKAIVTMRRLLLEATRAVERGERPKGADPATHRNIRPHDRVITSDSNWRETFGMELVAKW